MIPDNNEIEAHLMSIAAAHPASIEDVIRQYHHRYSRALQHKETAPQQGIPAEKAYYDRIVPDLRQILKTPAIDHPPELLIGKKGWGRGTFFAISYDGDYRIIKYTPNAECPKHSALAHELSHAVCFKELIERQSISPDFSSGFQYIRHLFRCSSAFLEGHAIGIENRFLDRDISEDARGVRIHLERRYGTLIRAYRSVMRQAGRAPSKALLNDPLHKRMPRMIVLSDRPSYGLGTIIFAIAEAKHGPDIYAEALRNPRVVLE